MAIGTDRYASRGDTLLFVACVGLSIAALSLPDQWRDPLAQGLRQSVLAPFLFLQRQTELLAAARYRYDARSEEHTSELQSLAYLVCRLLLEKKKRSTILHMIVTATPRRVTLLS